MKKRGEEKQRGVLKKTQKKGSDRACGREVERDKVKKWEKLPVDGWREKFKQRKRGMRARQLWPPI